MSREVLLRLTCFRLLTFLPAVPTSIADTAPTAAATPTLPTSNTSSMKRHHGSSDSRKAKMEALLQELEAEKASAVIHPFVPEKKGSFVQPGQEHLTTNIFVGNLAPSITEEQMTELFRQFGEHSVDDIMWILFYVGTLRERFVQHSPAPRVAFTCTLTFQSLTASRGLVFSENHVAAHSRGTRSQSKHRICVLYE